MKLITQEIAGNILSSGCAQYLITKPWRCKINGSRTKEIRSRRDYVRDWVLVQGNHIEYYRVAKELGFLSVWPKREITSGVSIPD